MSDDKENVIEFVRESSDVYFLLGTVCGAYQQMNEIAKHEFLNALKDKVNIAPDKKSTNALLLFIDSLEIIDK